MRETPYIEMPAYKIHINRNVRCRTPPGFLNGE
jgi:hypothetical protein